MADTNIVLTTPEQYEANRGCTTYTVLPNSYGGAREPGIPLRVQIERISEGDAVTWCGCFIPVSRLVLAA